MRRSGGLNSAENSLALAHDPRSIAARSARCEPDESRATGSPVIEPDAFLSPTPAGGSSDGDRALLSVALRAARGAAEIHAEALGSLDPSAWGEKHPSDFVTDVDRAAERRIVDAIRAAFPTHRILAEEGTGSEEGTGQGARTEEGPGAGHTDRSAGPGAASADVLWIVDPLDGTTNFLHAYPEYAVSIAALAPDGLRAAVVLNSATGEEYAAVRGGGATLDGRPIRVSTVDDIRLALVGTGFPFKRTELLPDYLETLGTVIEATSGVRRAGAAALDLCAVARGRLDAFWEHWLMPWDVAAGALIVMEAGGTFGGLAAGADHPLAGPARSGEEVSARFRGEPGDVVPGPGAFIAGNGRIDEAFQELLARTLSP